MEQSEVVREVIKKTIMHDVEQIRFWANKRGQYFVARDWDKEREASNLIDKLQIHIEELLKAL